MKRILLKKFKNVDYILKIFFNYHRNVNVYNKIVIDTFQIRCLYL